MKKILVIDDEPVIAYMVAASLKMAGVQHELDYCSDGAQGRTKAAGGGYDLITLDRNMPFVGGAETLTEIKRNPKSARIPVVVITAQRDPDFHKHVTDLGAAALVTKPFQPRKLGDLLRRVLAGEQAEAPPSPD